VRTPWRALATALLVAASFNLAVAGPRSVAALKGEVKRLERIADEWEPLAEGGDGWCRTVPGVDYVSFARDVGLTKDTAVLVFKGRARLAARVDALRSRLVALDDSRRRCDQIDSWNAERRVLEERAMTAPLAAVDELRIALDRWNSTFKSTSPPGFATVCATVLTSALTPEWPPDWHSVDLNLLRRRANVTRVLPECGGAGAEAGRILHATRAAIRELHAAEEATASGDLLGAEEILSQALRAWPESSRYPASTAGDLRAQIRRRTEHAIEDGVEGCRRVPEECAFARIRHRVDRLAGVASDDPSRMRLVADLVKRLDRGETEWIRFNRTLFGKARTLNQVDAQTRWIGSERRRLRSLAARVAFDGWKEELEAGSVGLRKLRVSLLGGTDVRLEGDHLCGTDGVPLGSEWGPKGETQARIRRFLRELRDATGLREPVAVLKAKVRAPGTPRDATLECDQVLILTAELTSCAVDALWEAELPRTLDRYFGQATGPRLQKRLLSPVRALIPAETYSIRLKNRSGRTFLIEMNRSGTMAKEHLDGILLNPQGTEAIPAEYVEVLRAVLADVRDCP
jgi:hypothetical protein